MCVMHVWCVLHVCVSCVYVMCVYMCGKLGERASGMWTLPLRLTLSSPNVLPWTFQGVDFLWILLSDLIFQQNLTCRRV